MNYPYKIVRFDEYCHKCKNKDTPETDNPCDKCLEVRVREATRMPEKYEEAKNGGRNG